MSQTITREQIEKLPKVELHCHLDGSLRIETILELAKERKVKLPTTNPKKLREILVQDNAANLVEYLKAFDVTLSVMQDWEALERIAYELIADVAQENCVYIEVRYAPVLHQRSGMKLTNVVEAVLSGLRRGEADFGVKWGLIICGMRMSDPQETLQMAELCVMYKHRGVVGFDLAGAEAQYPASDHRDAFGLILRNNVNITIHAGEAYGPESIRQALHECGAHRLGHAVRLKEDGDLLNYCCDHRIPLEINLTSNVQTGAVKSLQHHPLRTYYDFGLRCCICTDNRLISGVSLTDEFMIAHNILGFSLEEMKDLVIYGLKSSFLHYRDKVELINKVLPQLHAVGQPNSPCVDIPTNEFTQTYPSQRKIEPEKELAEVEE